MEKMHGFQSDLSDDIYESERELRGKHCRKLSRNTFGTVNSVAEAFALDYDEKNTTWMTEYKQQFFVPPPILTLTPAVVIKVDANKPEPEPFFVATVTDDNEEDDDDNSDEWVVIDQDDVPPLPITVSFNESELKTSKHLMKHHVAPISDQELALEDSFRCSRGFLARTPLIVPYNRYETEHTAAFTSKSFERRNVTHLYSNPSAIFNILEPDDNAAADTFVEEDITSIGAPERDAFMALYADEPPTVSEEKEPPTTSRHPKTSATNYTSSMLIAHVLDVASAIKPCKPPPVSPPTKLRSLSSAEKTSPASTPSSSNKRPTSAVKLPTDWSFKPHINQLVCIKSPSISTIPVYKPVDVKKQRLGGTAKTCYSAALHHKSINANALEHAKKTIQSTTNTITPQDLKKKRTSGTAKTMAIAAQKNKSAKSLVSTKPKSLNSSPYIPVSTAGDSYGSCMTDIRQTLISTVNNAGKTRLPIKREEFNFADIVDASNK